VREKREREREAGVVREPVLVRVSFAFTSLVRHWTKVQNRETVHEACVCFGYLSLTVYQQNSVLCWISKFTWSLKAVTKSIVQ